MGKKSVRRVSVAVVAPLLAAFLLVGCSDSSAGPALGPPVIPTIAPVQSGTVAVAVRDNDFVAKEISVSVGAEVVWRNVGRNDHNIAPVGDSGGFKVDTAKFGPKAEYRFTFTKPGTYRYFCSIHGTADKGMVGTVQVLPAQSKGYQL